MQPIGLDVALGTELVPLSMQLSKQMFGVGDLRTIHNDDEAARREGLPGAIAVGPQVAALIFRMMRMAFQEGWITSGQCELTFRRATGSDEFVTARARIIGKALAEAGVRVRCEVWVENSQGERTVTGQASALVR